MLIFKKEQRVVDLAFKHIEKSAECVQATTDSLNAYVDGDDSALHAAASRVYGLESEADALLREIRDVLYSGAYLPLIRGDIYHLMSEVDDVSNKAEACFDCFHNQLPDIPEEYRPEFRAVLDLTAECFAQFQKALKAFFGPKDKLEKVRQHSKNVSELESRIDEIERDLTTRIFQSSLDKGDKLHLRHCLRRIAAISDATEDAADELQLVSVKSIV